MEMPQQPTLTDDLRYNLSKLEEYLLHINQYEAENEDHEKSQLCRLQAIHDLIAINQGTPALYTPQTETINTYSFDQWESGEVPQNLPSFLTAQNMQISFISLNVNEVVSCPYWDEEYFRNQGDLKQHLLQVHTTPPQPETPSARISDDPPDYLEFAKGPVIDYNTLSQEVEGIVRHSDNLKMEDLHEELRQLELILKLKYPDLVLSVYGSSKYGIRTEDSNFDIFFDKIPAGLSLPPDVHEQLEIPLFFSALIQILKSRYTQIYWTENPPTVHFNTDYELPITLRLENERDKATTDLMEKMIQSHLHLQELLIFVKCWMQSQDFYAVLTPVGVYVMVLHFMYDCRQLGENAESSIRVGELIYDFFQFFSSFNWDTLIITKTGTSTEPIQYKRWEGAHIAIADPADDTQNLVRATFAEASTIKQKIASTAQSLYEKLL